MPLTGFTLTYKEQLWTLRQTPANNNWTAICWAPELGLFVAVANSGAGNRVMVSP